jgi:hypothetical protein
MTNCGCGSSCSSENKQEKNEKHLEIEFLYLDLSTCGRCQGTDSVIEEAIKDLEDILSEVGYTLSLTKTHIQSVQCAKDHAFVSSPTVRINNRDIVFETQESNCSSCGEVCGTDVDCRDWSWNGKTYDAPPKGMIIDAILSSIYDKNFGKEVDFKNYKVPENIIKFFEALNRK